MYAGGINDQHDPLVFGLIYPSFGNSFVVTRSLWGNMPDYRITKLGEPPLQSGRERRAAMAMPVFAAT